MRIPALLILLLIQTAPAEAVCNLCVFPVLAAAGTSALNGARYAWLTWMWAGAGAELLLLYLVSRAFNGKNPFHLDISILAQCAAASLMYFCGYKGLYAAAGIALVHIVLVIHCIVKSYKEIPYLRTILINTVLLAAGLFPFALAEDTAQTAVRLTSYILLSLHMGLYLLRTGLRYRNAG